MKGRGRRSDATTSEYLDSTAFGAPTAGSIAHSARLPHYTLQFDGKLFDALLPLFANGAATVDEWARRPELAAFDRTTIREAVLRLLVAGLVWPMQRSTRAPDAGPERRRVSSAYNRMVLRRRLANDVPVALASPVAGTGITISMLQAIALRLLTEAEPDGRSALLRELLREQPFRMKAGEQTVDGGDPERVVLTEMERYRSTLVPKLVELGVLE